jgi:YidC/Oxa1 family membrane protein insertase
VSNTIGHLLSPLTGLVHTVLFGIQSFTGFSWAWSIILLTILVRICLVPLTVKQMRSMQAMQRLGPEIKRLQEKFKDDKQELNRRMMEFYKENNVNPFSSCMPLLLQIPVFIALFYELRAFSKDPPSTGSLSFFFGQIPDITIHTSKAGWPGWVLIALYVVSQLASSLLMPNPDPRQRYIFMAMPFLFVLFVINFPVGLMLYWITSNLWTVGQQAAIRRFMPPPAIAGGAAGGGGSSGKRSSRAPKDPPEPPAKSGSPSPRKGQGNEAGSAGQGGRRRKR